MSTVLKSRLKKWLRRATIALALLLAIALALPFLFTTSIARFALAHSAYARFNPTLDSAALSPSGILTITGLTLHDTGDNAADTLAAVESIRIEFHWTQVLSSRLTSVQADGLTLYARPDSRHAITLAKLAESQTPAAPAAKPLWLDHLACTGILTTTAPDGWTLSQKAWPFRIAMTMSGDPSNPARQLTLDLGRDAVAPAPAAAPASAPTPDAAGLHAQLLAEPTPQGVTLRLEACTAHHLRATLAAPQARAMLATLPPEFQRQLSATLGQLSLTGTLATTTPLTFTGQIAIADLSITNHDAASPARITNASLRAAVVIPLTPTALRDARITGAVCTADDIVAGPQQLANISTDWTLADGELAAANTRLRVADGTLAGRFRCNLLTGAAPDCDFTFDHIAPNALYAGAIPAGLGLPSYYTGTLRMQRTVSPTIDYAGQISLAPTVSPATAPASVATTSAPPSPPTLPATTPAPPAPPELLVRFHTQGNCQSVSIDEATIHRFQLALNPDRASANAKTLIANLPAQLQRPWSGQLAQATLTGTLALQPAPHFTGHITLQDLTAATLPNTGHTAEPAPIRLANANLAATLDLPLAPNPLPNIVITDATLTAAEITYPNAHLTDLFAHASLRDATLSVTDAHAAYADGNFTGHLQYDLTTGALPDCNFTFHHLSPNAIYPHAIPDGLLLATHYDGTLQLRRTGSPGAEYAGSLALTFLNPLSVPAAAGTPHGNAVPATAPATATSASTLSLRFHTFDQAHSIAIEEARLTAFHAALTPAFLARLYPAAKTYVATDTAIDADSLLFRGTLEPFAAPRHLTGQIDLANLSVAATSPTGKPLNLKRASMFALIDTPLDASAKTLATIQAGTFSLDEAALADNTARAVAARLACSAGTFHITDLAAALFGGTITGRMRYDLAHNNLTGLDLDIAHIDQHQVLKNLSPDKVDAQGSLSGPVKFYVSTKDKKLHVDADLKSDGPGRLLVADEDLRRAIAGNVAVTIPDLPPDWANIFMAQLKDYPYSTAHIQLADPQGMPLLTLNYDRLPLQPGDPGYDIKMTRQVSVAGVPVQAEVRVSLKCNLRNTTVRVPTTVESLLKTAAGLQSLAAPSQPPPP